MGAAAAEDDGGGGWRWAVPGTAVTVRAVRLATPHHFTHHKPWWMEDVLARDPEATGVIGTDPDVVVKVDWDFVEEWVSGGIAVVTDIMPEIGAGHPHRRAWGAWLEEGNPADTHSRAHGGRRPTRGGARDQEEGRLPGVTPACALQSQGCGGLSPPANFHGNGSLPP